MTQYVTEDKATVQTGDHVYDYYSMEPIVIGSDCGDSWFHTQSVDDPTKRSRAGMLNGARICTMGFAKRQGFKGA